jgi:Single-strand binding protein family
MAADNHTTIVGNLVEDPELRFTNAGIAVANLRVAVKGGSGRSNAAATSTTHPILQPHVGALGWSRGRRLMRGCGGDRPTTRPLRRG